MLSADGTLTGYENLLIFAKLYDIPRAERKPRVHEALRVHGPHGERPTGWSARIPAA